MKIRRLVLITMLLSGVLSMVACAGKDHRKDTAVSENADMPMKDKTEPEQEEPWKEDRIEIYSRTYHKTLETAYELFVQENPEISIKLCWGEENQDDNLIEEMMEEGNGPDIVLIDGMEIESDDKSRIFMPIKESFSDDNKIEALKSMDEYTIPARVYAPYIFVRDTKYVGNELFSDDANAELFAGWKPEELIEALYLYYGAGLISSEGNLNEELLKEMLDFVKKGYDAGSAGNVAAADVMNTEKFVSNDFPILCCMVKEMDDIKYPLNAILEEDGRAALIEGLIPGCQMAVSKSSPMQEECIKFINTVLSEKVQTENNSEGFPVNQDALLTWLADYQANGEEEALKAVDESHMEQFFDIIQTKSFAYHRDKAVLDILKKDITSYVKGKKSLESIISTIKVGENS